jgi:hypothetical protein
MPHSMPVRVCFWPHQLLLPVFLADWGSCDAVTGSSKNIVKIKTRVLCICWCAALMPVSPMLCVVVRGGVGGVHIRLG